MASSGNNKGETSYGLAAVVFLIAVFLLMVSTNMQKGLSHDEHMYVAAGTLLGRNGLLPYRDYPFFQAPNLVFVYAAIFQGTNHLLLAARLFSTLCSTLSLAALFHTASSLFRNSHPVVRFGVSTGGVLLLASNPIFVYTTGLAWNHDLPVLLTLLAILVFCSYMKQRGVGRVFLAGVLIGSVTGTRLSFAPVILPFLGGVFLLPDVVGRKKFQLSCVFVIGTLVALAPSLVLFALAPGNFAFDNLRYHLLNETYWQQMGYSRAMTLPGKLAYLGDVINEPATLALVASLLLLIVLAIIKTLRTRLPGYFEFAFTLSLIPFLLAGALAPTPTWYQYFYPLVPIFVLCLVYGMALFGYDSKWRGWVLVAFGLAVLISGALAILPYLRLNRSLTIADWEPIKIHAVGLEIERAVGKERVLTLAPLYPLEGGTDVYGDLATGPFAWRIANLLPGEQRKELDIISSADLENLLRGKPPKFILVSLEPNLEQSMVKYAQEHGYMPEKLSNGATLWVAR